MHRFSFLIEGCVAFISSRIDEAKERVGEILADDASSVHIKNLQSLNLQYAITAVGMFSIFEADVQRELGHDNGFQALRELLARKGENALLESFEIYLLAVNVLKHGYGRSHDELLKMKNDLPFMIKERSEDYFKEGDCSEIDTLILADGDFVMACASIIHRASEVIFQEQFGSYQEGQVQ